MAGGNILLHFLQLSEQKVSKSAWLCQRKHKPPILDVYDHIYFEAEEKTVESLVE